MCGLFGMFDTKGIYSGKERAQIVHALACESEVRGTDATGIAYNVHGQMQIKKRAVKASKLKFKIPEVSRAVVGHTRMSTQGTELFNFNNHPFYGRAGVQKFVLAHNGVIHNDEVLRREKELPKTKIETDSFVMVQLIEKQNKIDHESLKETAEALRGTFTFTVMDDHNRIYFVKGNNPLCIYHYPSTGLYLYASTKEILEKAILNIPILCGTHYEVMVSDGEIMSIDSSGKTTRSHFDVSNLASRFSYYDSYYSYLYEPAYRRKNTRYIDELKSVAAYFGYTGEDIDMLIDEGIDPMEIEDYLYGLA